MNLRKYKQLTPIHRAVVEVNGDEVKIWIEKKIKKLLFITEYKRISYDRHIILTTKNSNAKTDEIEVYGPGKPVPCLERHIDNFDLSLEIKNMYEYLCLTLTKQEKINSAIKEAISKI